jgi:hypothetical protein
MKLLLLKDENGPKVLETKGERRTVLSVWLDERHLIRIIRYGGVLYAGRAAECEAQSGCVDLM